MKKKIDSDAVAMSPELLARIQAAAEEENRTIQEVFCEAIEQYLRARRSQGNNSHSTTGAEIEP